MFSCPCGLQSLRVICFRKFQYLGQILNHPAFVCLGGEAASPDGSAEEGLEERVWDDHANDRNDAHVRNTNQVNKSFPVLPEIAQHLVLKEIVVLVGPLNPVPSWLKALLETTMMMTSQA